MIEKRQGVKISSTEESAFHSSWISTEELLESAKLYGKSLMTSILSVWPRTK